MWQEYYCGHWDPVIERQLVAGDGVPHLRVQGGVQVESLSVVMLGVCWEGCWAATSVHPLVVPVAFCESWMNIPVDLHIHSKCYIKTCVIWVYSLLKCRLKIKLFAIFAHICHVNFHYLIIGQIAIWISAKKQKKQYHLYFYYDQKSDVSTDRHNSAEQLNTVKYSKSTVHSAVSRLNSPIQTQRDNEEILSKMSCMVQGEQDSERGPTDACTMVARCVFLCWVVSQANF